MAAFETEIEKAGREKVPRSFAGEDSRAASAVQNCSRQGARLGKGALRVQFGTAPDFGRANGRFALIAVPASGEVPAIRQATTSLRSFLRKFGRRGSDALPQRQCPDAPVRAHAQNYYWKNAGVSANLLPVNYGC